MTRSRSFSSTKRLPTASGVQAPRVADVPTMRAGTRRRVALFLRAGAAGLVVGAVFGGTTGSGFRDAPRPGALLGVLAGAINGVAIVGVIFGAKTFLSPTRFGQALGRLLGEVVIQ